MRADASHTRIYIRNPSGGQQAAGLRPEQGAYAVPNGTSTVVRCAFWNNAYLTSLTLPGSLKTLEAYSIGSYTDSALEELVYSPSVSSQVSAACRNCPYLTARTA
jgi:hypothetical protein